MAAYLWAADAGSYHSNNTLKRRALPPATYEYLAQWAGLHRDLIGFTSRQCGTCLSTTSQDLRTVLLPSTCLRGNEAMACKKGEMISTSLCWISCMPSAVVSPSLRYSLANAAVAKVWRWRQMQDMYFQAPSFNFLDSSQSSHVAQ
ncbi:hypothetical protein F442_22000 [Phytophthora nicotianae P10297]|uniref:Uncharacterized protein n=4 Tax=Phytophthora nicotianae TaxID=4792 RepID=W2PE62_PHYN3|nr:hypothetical protein PPTG_24429 [Phytophthora nicotianae INRA-310]ETI30762.1 hypothetical protein F443_22136 [Phytophthora nicotianae P1569]ETM99337.1 hypothetical protein PPTG_24429 [Phytophthora nicotianae INRA-310]ETO74405.1 hypothetical protein F444_09838 [Phytophthora nicotianae P1976]ETP28727.1 hypothetical protein F442_22000 [Phytophthora nicotianae P10297]